MPLKPAVNSLGAGGYHIDSLIIVTQSVTVDKNILLDRGSVTKPFFVFLHFFSLDTDRQDDKQSDVNRVYLSFSLNTVLFMLKHYSHGLL